MSVVRMASFGVAIWAFVFMVAILAFPLRAGDRPLFESIMPVALALAVTAASVMSFRNVARGHVSLGIRLALVWLGVNLLFDFLAFSRGPMQMDLVDYLKDIGVTYLMIPVVPVGFGYALAAGRD